MNKDSKGIEITKDNFFDVLLNAKEYLKYTAIDTEILNPVNLKEIYNLKDEKE